MHPFWGGCWWKTGLKCGPQGVQSFLRTAGSWAGCGAGRSELCLGGGTRSPPRCQLPSRRFCLRIHYGSSF